MTILSFAAPSDSIQMALRNAVQEASDSGRAVHIWTPAPGDLTSSPDMPPDSGTPFLRILPDGTVYLALSTDDQDTRDTEAMEVQETGQ